jgi:hypothetical protein
MGKETQTPISGSVYVSAGFELHVTFHVCDWRYQREGMGLLEYQAMPSLHDVAHDGWYI